MSVRELLYSPMASRHRGRVVRIRWSRSVVLKVLQPDTATGSGSEKPLV